MKKLALLLALVLVFSLAACNKTTDGKTDPDAATTTTTTVAAPTRSDTFTVGTVSGTSYQNPYFGLGCTLDSGWMIDNAATCNTAFSEASDLNAAAANAQQFDDMLAFNSANGCMVKVGVENLALLWDHIPSMDEYAEMQRIVNEGNPDLVLEDITATVGNLSCKGLRVTVDENQVDTFYYISAGKYMVSLLISASDAAAAEQVLAQFYTF